jgi:hypothetical protein
MVGVFSVTDLRKKWVLNKLIYLNTAPKRAAKLGNERKVYKAIAHRRHARGWHVYM